MPFTRHTCAKPRRCHRGRGYSVLATAHCRRCPVNFESRFSGDVHSLLRFWPPNTTVAAAPQSRSLGPPVAAISTRCPQASHTHPTRYCDAS